MCAPVPGPTLDDCYKRMSGPPSIMWDVTNRCNLDCLHCYNQSGKDPLVNHMDTEAMLGVADQLLEMRPFVICMCGGEPLLRRDLETLVAHLRRDVPHVNMVSNGWLLTSQRLEGLLEAGVKSIQISLDGASALTHDNIRGMAGAWERAVAAIRLLVESDMCPPVTLIPHRLNYLEIEDWAELCLDLGVNTLRLMPLIPIGRARDNSETLELGTPERMQILAALRRIRLRHPEVSVEWGDPLEHIYNFTDPDNPMRTYSLEVRSDGKLVVSTYLPLVVGDLRRHTLKEYWDAGLADIWRHPRVRGWAERLRCLPDFADQSPQPWSGTDVEFDIIDDQDPAGAVRTEEAS
jgi:MoaA/NifB/PqqE/SkfB family radical SAM enzyme